MTTELLERSRRSLPRAGRDWRALRCPPALADAPSRPQPRCLQFPRGASIDPVGRPWPVCQSMIRSTSSREMVSLAPLRLRNFAGLSMGHSLVRQGSLWGITVPGTEIKNHRPYERPFPERLLPALQRYLDQVRPALLQRKGWWARPVGSALWVSCHGSPLSEAAIHQQVVAYTAAEFGAPVNRKRRLSLPIPHKWPLRWPHRA